MKNQNLRLLMQRSFEVGEACIRAAEELVAICRAHNSHAAADRLAAHVAELHLNMARRRRVWATIEERETQSAPDLLEARALGGVR